MHQDDKHGRLDMFATAEMILDNLSLAGIGQSRKNPVILIGQDIGGLVLKETCLRANSGARQDQRKMMFLQQLKGIFYFSTPHLGLDHEMHYWDPACQAQLMKQRLADPEKQVVVLWGDAGTGKSSVTKYLALQYDMETGPNSEFWDGVFYIECGREAELLPILRGILREMRIEEKGISTTEDVDLFCYHLRKTLRSLNALFILDDVWEDQRKRLVEKVIVQGATKVKYLFTSQQSLGWRGYDICRIENITLQTAKEIMAKQIGHCRGHYSSHRLSSTGPGNGVYGSKNHWGQMAPSEWKKVKRNLQFYLSDYKEAVVTFGESYPRSVFAAMKLGVRVLLEDQAKVKLFQLLCILALFESPFPQKLPLLLLLWAESELSMNFTVLVEELEGRGFVQTLSTDTQFQFAFDWFPATGLPASGLLALGLSASGLLKLHCLRQYFILRLIYEGSTSTFSESDLAFRKSMDAVKAQILPFLSGNGGGQSPEVEDSVTNVDTASISGNLLAVYGVEYIRQKALSSQLLPTGLLSVYVERHYLWLLIMDTEEDIDSTILRSLGKVVREYILEYEIDDDGMSNLISQGNYGALLYFVLCRQYIIATQAQNHDVVGWRSYPKSMRAMVQTFRLISKLEESRHKKGRRASNVIIDFQQNILVGAVSDMWEFGEGFHYTRYAMIAFRCYTVLFSSIRSYLFSMKSLIPMLTDTIERQTPLQMEALAVLQILAANDREGVALAAWPDLSRVLSALLPRTEPRGIQEPELVMDVHRAALIVFLLLGHRLEYAKNQNGVAGMIDAKFSPMMNGGEFHHLDMENSYGGVEAEKINSILKCIIDPAEHDSVLSLDGEWYGVYLYGVDRSAPRDGPFRLKMETVRSSDEHISATGKGKDAIGNFDLKGHLFREADFKKLVFRKKYVSGNNTRGKIEGGWGWSYEGIVEAGYRIVSGTWGDVSGTHVLIKLENIGKSEDKKKKKIVRVEDVGSERSFDIREHVFQGASLKTGASEEGEVFVKEGLQRRGKSSLRPHCRNKSNWPSKISLRLRMRQKRMTSNPPIPEYVPVALYDLFFKLFREKMAEGIGWDSHKPGDDGLAH
ncbi:hypothetical protein R1flu_011156 [Riccia fluitans]|uniref:NB-ARC domain-containing protein n=1 Tax=Riccia fluitans TaxID=41844 RepID=A0ABD1Z829_9MARC